MDRVFPFADRQGSSSRAPLVSVIMSAYNVERYIGEAIESILHQTFRDFEFIIVNDGSHDATLEIIQKYAQVDGRIIHRSLLQNLGTCCAKNVGLELARGTYIALMDADDIVVPERLEKQVRFLEGHPEIGLVGGAMLIVNESNIPIGSRRYPTNDAQIRKRMFRYNPFCSASIMVRRLVMEKAGKYDETLHVAEDYEWHFRIGMVTQCANLHDPIYRYRVWPHSLTHVTPRRVELTTIGIRSKYFRDYGASFTDRVYNFLHLLSVLVIPYRWKQWGFSLIRSFLV